MNKISASSYWDLIYPSVTVHSSASATITVAGKSFTSDVSGNTFHPMPWGTFSISDSVSGQSFECTIDKDVSDVYAMPEGALYWYGNMCDWTTGGYSSNGYTFNSYDTEGIDVSESINYNINSIYFIGRSGYPIYKVGTNNLLNLSNCSRINVIGNATSLYNNVGLQFALASKKSMVYNNTLLDINIDITKKTYSFDISNISSAYLILRAGLNLSCKGYLYAIWVE